MTNQEHFRFSLQLTLFIILFWLVLLGSIAIGSRFLPSRWYDHKRAFFRTRKWEMRFYEAIHLRAWKDYLPELGGIVGFAKDRMPEVVDANYLDRFLWETCYTETSHWICMVLGWSFIPTVFLFDHFERYIGLFIGISCLNFVAHLPFIITQRYNRPRLESLRNRFRNTD